MNASLRLGIDVGGTNTDAVVVDGSGAVLATLKVPTTPEPLDGIRSAIEGVVTKVDRSRITRAGSVTCSRITVPRAKPLVVRRSMSTIWPLNTCFASANSRNFSNAPASPRWTAAR